MRLKLIVLMVFFVMPVLAMQKTAVEEIEELFEKVEQGLVSSPKELVVVLGHTGAGKSTLIDYLNDQALVWGRPSPASTRCVMLEDEGAANVCPIGKNLSISETFYPQIAGSYCDCPGFEDTRKFLDIANAYSIYKVLENANKIKVILTISAGNLWEDKGKVFLRAIEQLGTIFDNEIDKLLAGLCLVITKKTIYHEEINHRFRQIMSEQMNSLSDRSLKILKFLTDSYEERVSIFNHPHPTQEGPIAQEDKNIIKASIANAKYKKFKKPSFSLSSADSKLTVMECFDQLISSMTNIVEDMGENYLLYLDEYIKIQPKSEASILREEFGQIEQFLEGLSPKEEDVLENAESISSILKILFHNQHQQFSVSLKHLQFIKKLECGNGKNQAFPNWRSILANFLTDIKKAQVIDPTLKDGVFKLKGWIVGISDVGDILEEWGESYTNDISQINVYSLHSLLIDTDIRASGINMVFYSPYWWCIDDRKISLKGEDAPDHDPQKAQDGTALSPDGEDGLPGYPGSSGGHFYGIGKEFYDLKNLIINVSGGNGGKGQEGGDGAKGADAVYTGPEPDKPSAWELKKIKNLNTLEALEEDSVDAIKRAAFTYNKGSKKKYLYRYYGSMGGNAGKGGKGGYGGENGTAIIKTNDGKSIKDFTLRIVKAKTGDEGDAGVAGKGGKNIIKKRIYICEKAFGDPFYLRRAMIESLNIDHFGWKQLGCEVWHGAAMTVSGPVRVIASPISSATSSKWQGPAVDAKIKERASAGQVPNTLNDLGIKDPDQNPEIDEDEEEKIKKSYTKVQKQFGLGTDKFWEK